MDIKKTLIEYIDHQAKLAELQKILDPLLEEIKEFIFKHGYFSTFNLDRSWTEFQFVIRPLSLFIQLFDCYEQRNSYPDEELELPLNLLWDGSAEGYIKGYFQTAKEAHELKNRRAKAEIEENVKKYELKELKRLQEKYGQ